MLFLLILLAVLLLLFIIKQLLKKDMTSLNKISVTDAEIVKPYFKIEEKIIDYNTKLKWNLMTLVYIYEIETNYELKNSHQSLSEILELKNNVQHNAICLSNKLAHYKSMKF